MAEKEAVTNKRLSPDWFMRGALAKIGDTLDRFAGRHWQPSSSLATSELVERLRGLLDAEKREVPGKGFVVPHNIKLKMQWDKFSADDENESLQMLENELLIAAADHINDNLYYTYAPLHLEVASDYFTEGVKLLVSFDQFADDDNEIEMNVTMPLLQPVQSSAPGMHHSEARRQLVASFSLNGRSSQRTIEVPADGRLTVGRSGSNGLMIDDNSVSKVHASISVNNSNALSVADTGSTNGTFVNGERIAYGKAVAFSDADKVSFGSVDVRFELVLPLTAEDGEPDENDQESVQIDGLDFRSRTSTETPAPVSASKLETEKVDHSNPDPVANGTDTDGPNETENPVE